MTDEGTTSGAEVKRPYPRNAPCSVECRGDGNQILALIGPNIQEGACGFGEDLPSALRDLADILEIEVGEVPEGEIEIGDLKRRISKLEEQLPYIRNVLIRAYIDTEKHTIAEGVGMLQSYYLKCAAQLEAAIGDGEFAVRNKRLERFSRIADGEAVDPPAGELKASTVPELIDTLLSIDPPEMTCNTPLPDPANDIGGRSYSSGRQDAVDFYRSVLRAVQLRIPREVNRSDDH